MLVNLSFANKVNDIILHSIHIIHSTKIRLGYISVRTLILL